MVVDIDRIAELSKLSIPQDKKLTFEKQMNDIVAMADVLLQIEDENVFSDYNHAPLRDDTVIESNISYDIISGNAPCFENDCFCVPKTVE